MTRSAVPLLFLALALLPGCAPETSPEPASSAPATEAGILSEPPDLARFFDGVEGTFVLLDSRTGDVARHNPERARRRFLPASTFKIPNTLIALETGAAVDPDEVVAWDSVHAPRQSWWPGGWAGDHTLRTAFAGSVVWFYQDLARRIGPERMGDHLNRFGYGNQDLSGGIERFWLNGGLAISAEEQIRFLHRLHDGELGASPGSTALVKELLVLEETPHYRLSGKTGWVGFGEEDVPQVGWAVGYLERGSTVYFFATNLDMRTPADAAARLEITRSLLAELGLMSG